MAWTYILECSEDSYYVGSTTHLDARINRHDLGSGAAYTRLRRPVRSVWSHETPRISDAFNLEKQIQNWSRAKRRALIDGRFDMLPALARGRHGWMKRGVKETPDNWTVSTTLDQLQHPLGRSTNFHTRRPHFNTDSPDGE